MRRRLYTAAALACILAWSSPGATARDSGAGRAPYASATPVRAPAVFAPGVISTGDYDAHIAFTADGRTAYYLKAKVDLSAYTIVVSHFGGGRWSAPEVAPFSGRWNDADPFVAADGSRILFVSKRPGGMSDGKTDVWGVAREGDRWSEPRNLGPPVNSTGREWYPTVASDGTLYFGSDRPGGKGRCDLYRARFVDGRYAEPENLGDTVNTEFDEYEPFVAPDQSFLIFAAQGRPDGPGGFDLYVSYYRDGTWTKAVAFGAPINTAADEFGPKVSPDGRYLFWTSTRSIDAPAPARARTIAEVTAQMRSPGNGLGDIYYVDLAALGLER